MRKKMHGIFEDRLQLENAKNLFPQVSTSIKWAFRDAATEHIRISVEQMEHGFQGVRVSFKLMLDQDNKDFEESSSSMKDRQTISQFFAYANEQLRLILEELEEAKASEMQLSPML